MFLYERKRKAIYGHDFMLPCTLKLLHVNKIKINKENEFSATAAASVCVSSALCFAGNAPNRCLPTTKQNTTTSKV